MAEDGGEGCFVLSPASRGCYPCQARTALSFREMHAGDREGESERHCVCVFERGFLIERKRGEGEREREIERAIYRERESEGGSER